MKKRIIQNLLLLSVCVILFGCGKESTEQTTTETATTEEITTEAPTTEMVLDSTFQKKEEIESVEENEVSKETELINEQVRKQAGAHLLIQDGWIYGLTWDGNGNGIFAKMREDGEDYTKLDDVGAKYMSVKEGYLYYARWSSDEDGGIYRMRTSGEDKEKIVDKTGIVMQVVGDTIYYTSDSFTSAEEVTDETAHLYKCDLDGKNETEVISKPTYCWYVFENAILYQDDRDNCSLHICDLDGKNDKKLNNDLSFAPVYDGEYIYYVKSTSMEEDSVETIWRIKVDGTGDEQVSEYQIAGSEFALYNDYIFFMNGEDNNRVYRMKKDGSDLTLISQDKNTKWLYFIENRLCYTVCADDYEYIDFIAISDYDGSDMQKLTFD